MLHSFSSSEFVGTAEARLCLRLLDGLRARRAAAREQEVCPPAEASTAVPENAQEPAKKMKEQAEAAKKHKEAASQEEEMDKKKAQELVAQFEKTEADTTGAFQAANKMWPTQEQELIDTGRQGYANKAANELVSVQHYMQQTLENLRSASKYGANDETVQAWEKSFSAWDKKLSGQVALIQGQDVPGGRQPAYEKFQSLVRQLRAESDKLLTNMAQSKYDTLMKTVTTLIQDLERNQGPGTKNADLILVKGVKDQLDSYIQGKANQSIDFDKVLTILGDAQNHLAEREGANGIFIMNRAGTCTVDIPASEVGKMKILVSRGVVMEANSFANFSDNRIALKVAKDGNRLRYTFSIPTYLSFEIKHGDTQLALSKRKSGGPRGEYVTEYQQFCPDHAPETSISVDPEALRQAATLLHEQRQASLAYRQEVIKPERVTD